MRTTIELPDDLFRRVKAQAALDGITLKELFKNYVLRGLERDSPRAEAVRTRQRSELPVLRAATGSRLPEFSNSQLHEILERDEIADGWSD